MDMKPSEIVNLYLTWRSMKARCDNPNTQSYQNYGARGIKVCERWQDFDNFVADMGKKPSPNHSIERKDNNGNYEPGNCCWATHAEQARNKRNSRFVTINGVRKHLSEWAEELGVQPSALTYRMRRGWGPERVMAQPKPERPNAKLDLARAQAIRAAYPAKSSVELAAQYGVDKKTVLNILHNRIYTDDAGPPADLDVSQRPRKTPAHAHLITANGETCTVAEWARRLDVSPNTIQGRLRNGWAPEDAVTIRDQPKHNQKLTPEDAAEIRRLYPGVPSTKLAAQFGVSKKSILNVLHEKTFKP